MNYGRFFSLDYDSSLFQNGMAIYHYREIEDREKKDNNLHSSRFPIYVTISKESIDFRAHYYSDKQEKPTDSPTHLHHLILSLPISTNMEIKDRLTEVLAEAYDSIFPPESKSNNYGNRNYLYGLVAGFEKKKHSIAYDTLDVFNVYDADNHLQTDNNGQINSFLRKLILDFIFDLEHTRIFQTSTNYEYISVKLRENLFFNALADKAKYYFYNDLIIRRQEPEQKQANIRFHKFFNNIYNKPKYYPSVLDVEYQLKAEVAWTKCIRHSQSDALFYAGKGWFQNPEIELMNVYKKRSFNKYFAKIKGTNNKLSVDNRIAKKAKESAEISSKWFAKRYAYQSLFTSILSINKHIVFLLLIPFLLFALFQIGSTFLGTLAGSYISSSNKYWLATSLAYLVCFGGTSIILGIKKNFFGIHLFIPRLWVVIIASWATLFPITGIMSNNMGISKISGCTTLINQGGNSLFTDFVQQSDAFGVFLFLILCFIILFVYNQISNILLFDSFWAKFKRTFFFIGVGFFYSFLTGKVIWSFFTNKTFCGFYQEFIYCLLNREFLLYTFVAMFLGIVIQLALKDQAISEGL